MCTIANTPRIPEHCIAYAYEVLWDKSFPDIKVKKDFNYEVDKDSFEHLNWIYEQAL